MPGSITTPLNGRSFKYPEQRNSAATRKQYALLHFYNYGAARCDFNPPTMCYSVVDMSLNGGNGNLISVNNTLIDSTTEKIAVVGNV